MTRPRATALAVLVLLAGCTPAPVPLRRVYHPSDADLTVTRIVHGSLVLDLRGTRLVVDPWFHSGWLTRQREPLGLTPEDLPPLAAVLLTHEHADRFDARALRGLAERVPVVVAPPPLAPRLGRLGFQKVVALDWWERTTIGGVSVTAVPARHAVRENGYVVEHDGVRAYVGGDTRLFPELVDIATRFPRVDVALLPIGGERVLGLLREMTPEDAARAAVLLEARRVIPVGYGERWLLPLRWSTWRPGVRFRAACTRLGLDPGRIVVLEPGESWHYYR